MNPLLTFDSSKLRPKATWPEALSQIVAREYNGRKRYEWDLTFVRLIELRLYI